MEVPKLVLVLAPHFPSINQPWIDTYLEALLAQGITFRVLSWNRSPDRYSDKVERLGLRAHAVLAPRERWALLASVVESARGAPALSIKVLISSFRSGQGQSLRRRIGRGLRGLAALGILKRYPAAAVIHSHSEFMSSAFLEAAKTLAIPLVVTFHGMPPHGVKPISPFRRQQIAAYTSAVLVNTRFARSQAVQMGYRDTTVRVVPQGLPLDDFPASGGERDPFATNDTVRILSVGRLHRDKGHGYALIALARLARTGLDLRWQIIGSGPDRNRLERLAQRLSIAHLISFAQSLSFSELLGCYRASHLFVLASVPSRTPDEHVETQGVVLQEAQASGCIPIATRVGGIPECINHGEDGWLVKPRSHRAIALAITELVARRHAWPEIRKLGRQNVETRFSAQAVGEQVADILEQAARRPLATTAARSRVPG